ncbi:MAG TPA: hypothetical protein VFX60_15015 [Micromonospora sp.]|nr:hypothetical protein [Micromonospora sp.]
MRTDRSNGEATATPSAMTAPVHDPEPPRAESVPPIRLDPTDVRRTGPAPDEREAERALRNLVGAGASQLSVSAALRARDAARPTAADLAEAEERVVLIRRNWVPPGSQRPYRTDQGRAGS